MSSSRKTAKILNNKHSDICAAKASSLQNQIVAEQDSSWVVALTGASGQRYGLRLIRVLAQMGISLHVLLSKAAQSVLAEEEGIKFSYNKNSAKVLLGDSFPDITFHQPENFAASIASGSARFKGMVVVPCSMSSLAAIASGVNSNLIHRAADVTLKEGRKLILVPRETPLSAIHLENMLKLSRAGAVILPAMPGFYHKPESIADMLDMLVMKILDQMGIPNDLARRWQ